MATKKTDVDMLILEREQWSRGKSIAGMDEAGRGPLAGPVSAACVIMPQTPIINGIKDSKMLTELRRSTLERRIKETALCYNIAFTDVETINEQGIQPATIQAFSRAYEGMEIKPDCTFADYIVGLRLATDLKVFPHGDAQSYSIAAASILAKTARDAYMLKLHEKYPEYGFHKNKGYGTALHIAAIAAFGKSPVHRNIFVESALKKFNASSRTLSKSDLGYLGERHAERYLKNCGFVTLERNYRAEHSEIDLIMRDGNTTVFVEVKSRFTEIYGTGAEAVTLAKQYALRRAALAYISQHELADTPMRFDVVEVSGSYMSPDIRHMDSAFAV